MAKFLSFKFLRDLIFAQTEHARYKIHMLWKLHVFKFLRFLTFAKIKSQQTFPVIRYNKMVTAKYEGLKSSFNSQESKHVSQKP